jgi:hypothetical protein
VDNLDVACVPEGGEGRVEAGLPDPAPGTDHVRPDLDLHADTPFPTGQLTPVPPMPQ